MTNICQIRHHRLCCYWNARIAAVPKGLTQDPDAVATSRNIITVPGDPIEIQEIINEWNDWNVPSTLIGYLSKFDRLVRRNFVSPIGWTLPVTILKITLSWHRFNPLSRMRCGEKRCQLRMIRGSVWNGFDRNKVSLFWGKRFFYLGSCLYLGLGGACLEKWSFSVAFS